VDYLMDNSERLLNADITSHFPWKLYWYAFNFKHLNFSLSFLSRKFTIHISTVKVYTSL
jgi:hypothetical protein